jgi:hypothetical protein
VAFFRYSHATSLYGNLRKLQYSHPLRRKHYLNMIFCSDRCLAAGQAAQAASRVDPTLVRQEIENLFNGPCPKCSKQNGPVDIRKSHEVWSAIILTRWSTQVALSCKSCASKRQLGAILFCGFAGWWGFPWGLIVTPIQIVRNTVELFTPNAKSPSPSLDRLVRIQLGSQIRSTPPPLPQNPYR